MRIVIIGAGNVASVFGRLIKRANHEIIQVYSRDIIHAQSLANELNCAFEDDLNRLDMSADMYIVAIVDSALPGIYELFHVGDKLIVHTAGSVSKDVLKMVSLNYGVIYPLQSLRKDNPDLQLTIPLLIDGNSEAAFSTIKQFALTISPIVSRIDDEQRLKLHVAAVIVNNFTNYLYTLAANYCKKENIDFKMLQPLIEETALRIRDHAPGNMQTGPAARKDIATLNNHLLLLSKHPELKKMYLRMTDSIMNPEPC
ncbi:MAG: hypothetical protein JWP81_3358 [Ferruginibacter sp.]|nr:hypothetical protein [Ferruginibacter sp.]